MNAIAHAMEGLYAPDRSPIMSLMASRRCTCGGRGLAENRSQSRDVGARSEALYGAWLCGAVLGATTMSLQHTLCHVLGGTFNLPHAQTHAIVLPHVMAFNAPHAPDMVEGLTGAFGDGDPWTALWRLQQKLPMPTALSDLGLRRGDPTEVARQVTATPHDNPRPITPADVYTVLARAWAGQEPAPSATAAEPPAQVLDEESS